MPELPEVETIRTDLLPRVVGRSFVEVTCQWPKALATPPFDAFHSGLRHRSIQELQRRGKYLIFALDGGYSLIFHLRMTGRLFLRPAGAAPDPYTHTVFFLDDGHELRFADPRKFGRFWLVSDVSSVVGGLGPDPLNDGLSGELLFTRMTNRTVPIKALLLDQGFVAGVGNIYTNEALFLAGIAPQRPAPSLSSEEAERLAQGLQQALREGLAHRGTSRHDYLDIEGKAGSHQDHLRVHGRRGQPCPCCATPIVRIALRGRGTYYCPFCQQ